MFDEGIATIRHNLKINERDIYIISPNVNRNV